MVSFVSLPFSAAARPQRTVELPSTRIQPLVPSVTTERHRAILRLLAESGSISLAEIAERFSISAATARRDAMLLTSAGRARRRHGSLATAVAAQNEQHFRARSLLRTGAKIA